MLSLYHRIKMENCQKMNFAKALNATRGSFKRYRWKSLTADNQSAQWELKTTSY